MKKEKLQKLIDSKSILTKVSKLGSNISKDYKNKKPIVIGVLNGSFIFLADLARNIDIDFEIDFVKLSSYRNGTSNEQIRLESDINKKILNRNIIIAEDIIDTGISLKYLKEHLQTQNPKTIRTCVLIDKLYRRQVNIDIHYKGFEVNKGFLVGYGMDYKDWGRNFPDIYVLEQYP